MFYDADFFSPLLKSIFTRIRFVTCRSKNVNGPGNNIWGGGGTVSWERLGNYTTPILPRVVGNTHTFTHLASTSMPKVLYLLLMLVYLFVLVCKLWY